MNKLTLGISIAALIVAVFTFVMRPVSMQIQSPTLGGFTNYDQLAIGSSTPAAAYELVVSGTGTTSVAVGSVTSGKPGCLEFTTTSGSTTRAYISGTSSPAWVLAAGTCK